MGERHQPAADDLARVRVMRRRMVTWADTAKEFPGFTVSAVMAWLSEAPPLEVDGNECPQCGGTRTWEQMGHPAMRDSERRPEPRIALWCQPCNLLAPLATWRDATLTNRGR